MDQQKKRCQNAVGKRDFVTFAMMSVKHSVTHSPSIGEIITPNMKKRAETHGPT